MTSCWISDREGNGSEKVNVVPRPDFSSPMENGGSTSSSGGGTGLSGSDSDWLVSSSDASGRRGGGGGGAACPLSHGWLRHSSAVERFLLV